MSRFLFTRLGPAEGDRSVRPRMVVDPTWPVVVIPALSPAPAFPWRLGALESQLGTGVPSEPSMPDPRDRGTEQSCPTPGGEGVAGTVAAGGPHLWGCRFGEAAPAPEGVEPTLGDYVCIRGLHLCLWGCFSCIGVQHLHQGDVPVSRRYTCIQGCCVYIRGPHPCLGAAPTSGCCA